MSILVECLWIYCFACCEQWMWISSHTDPHDHVTEIKLHKLSFSVFYLNFYFTGEKVELLTNTLPLLWSNDRLTLPKGVYSLRYFLSPMRIPNLVMHIFILPTPFVVCSCIYASLLQLVLNAYTRYTHWVFNCNSQTKCIYMYAWANNKRIWHNEHMH